MKTCKKCNLTFEDNKKFCKSCGAKLTSDQLSNPQVTAKILVFEEKIKADPLNTSILIEYAELLIKNSQFDDVLAIIYKIIAIDEKNLKAQFLLLISLKAINKTEDALITAYKLSEISPNDINVLSEIVSLETIKENYEKVLDASERIIKLQPKHKDAWISKANALTKLNKIDNAIEAWSKVNEVDISNSSAKLYLAINAVKNKDYSKALELLKQTVDKFEKETRKRFLGLIYLADTNIKLKKGEDGISNYYKELIEIGKQEWLTNEIKEILSNIAEYLGNKSFDENKLKEAMSFFENADEFFHSDKVSESLALVYSKMGKQEIEKGSITLASHYLSKSLRIKSQNSEVKNDQKYIVEKIKAKKKKKRIANFFVLIVISIVIAASVFLVVKFKAQKEIKLWEYAKQGNTTESYQMYISKYPEGKFIIEAETLLESALWEYAKQKNTTKSYQMYINKYPEGKFVIEAETLLENALWEDTKSINTFKSYKSFIEKYPNTKFFNKQEKLSYVGGKNSYFRFDEGDIPYFKLEPGQISNWIWVKDYYLVNYYTNKDFTIVYRNGSKKKIEKESNNPIVPSNGFKIIAPDNSSVIVGFAFFTPNNIRVSHKFTSNDEYWVTDYVFSYGEEYTITKVRGIVKRVNSDGSEAIAKKRTYTSMCKGSPIYKGSKDSEITIEFKKKK